MTSQFENEVGFSQEFLLKKHFFGACYLGFDLSGCRVLIKAEIFIATGMVWLVSSDGMEGALKTRLRLVFLVHLCCLDMFGYQMKQAYSFLRYYSLVSGYCMKFYFSCFIYLLLCVWISDETLLLVFKKNTFQCYVWISEETLLLVF